MKLGHSINIETLNVVILFLLCIFFTIGFQRAEGLPSIKKHRQIGEIIKDEIDILLDDSKLMNFRSENGKIETNDANSTKESQPLSTIQNSSEETDDLGWKDENSSLEFEDSSSSVNPASMPLSEHPRSKPWKSASASPTQGGVQSSKETAVHGKQDNGAEASIGHRFGLGFSIAFVCLLVIIIAALSFVLFKKIRNRPTDEVEQQQNIRLKHSNSSVSSGDFVEEVHTENSLKRTRSSESETSNQSTPSLGNVPSAVQSKTADSSPSSGKSSA